MKAGFKKDLQYYKFCLYGFLKNQKFYEPFFLLYLLDKDISFLQAGVLYSIKELTINILEIPAGIVADSGGRRRSMLFSFTFYILSFIIFFISNSYLPLVIAMIVFALGDVFRTGTHKAMIFDYLDSKGWNNYRVNYYGNTRSWSQAGSALSALIAAIIVIIYDNYTYIFAFAIIPYLLNFLNLLSYPKQLDGETEKLRLGDFSGRLRESLRALIKNLKQISRIKLYLNSTLISGTFNASKDYLQPLILSLAILLGSVKGMGEEDSSSMIIGIIYSLIFLINSFASRMSGRVKEITGNESRGLNISYMLFALAMTGAAVFYHFNIFYPAIFLFVLIYSLENVRRPMAISAISSASDKKQLATCLSVDSLLKSLITILLGPVIGFLADMVSPGAGLLAPVAILLVFYGFVKLKVS